MKELDGITDVFFFYSFKILLTFDSYFQSISYLTTHLYKKFCENFYIRSVKHKFIYEVHLKACNALKAKNKKCKKS